MSEGKILLVDDESDYIEALSERMCLRDIEVLTASNGLEALELVEREDFDVVVLDMMMPGIDGLETLKRMLQLDENLQVIMLTGHATVQNGVEAMKLGAKDFLEKPVNIEKLLEMIKEAKINRMVIIQKQSEELVRNILKRKGW